MDTHIQKQFIALLKNVTPSHLSLAEELSELLETSLDSIYRRLRCQTELTLSETFSICKHFDLPLESLSEINSEIVAFKTNKLSSDTESFGHYLQVLHNDLGWIMKYPNYHLIYACEDLPVFYNFFFPRLGLFKMIYWNKSILNSDAFQDKKIDEIKLPAAWMTEVPKIQEKFLRIPSTEIWNDDTLKSTLQQIKFYWESGFFEEKNSVLCIIDDLDSIVSMAAKQCSTGKKYNPIKDEFLDIKFTLYNSELMIGNNTVQLRSDINQASYIGYNSFNFMRSNNKYFNESIYSWLNNMISKSTMLSVVAEKSRNQFFQHLHNSIDIFRHQVLTD